MRATRIVLTGLVAGLCACSSPPTSRPNPNPVPGTQPRASGSSAAPTPRHAPASPAAAPEPAPAPVVPSRSAPSLEQERAAQAERAAAALSKKTGIQVEKVETASPGWWPQGSAGGNGYGRGRAPTLEGGYQQATRQASGGDHAASVQKAAYTRTAMGDFTVWVAMGVQAAATPTPAPVAPAPAPAAPSAPPPAPAAAASDIPSWFTTKAKEENGRVIVGAMADAPTVREAPRMASEAGKAALAEVMGVEPSEVRLESTYVRKQGEGYRAYVLISCAGTIKK